MTDLSPMPARPALTPAERLDVLIDEIATYQSLLAAANRYADMIQAGEGLPDDHEMRSLDAMYDASDTGAMRICHVARTLMADGLLERCAALLRQEAGVRV